MFKAILFACALAAASCSVATADDSSLAGLSARYKVQEEFVREAREKAKTPEEQQAVFVTADPRNVFVDDFLKVEAAHRGEPDAISALFHLMRHAVSVGDPDAKATQGRVKAIQVLREHYVQHPDLDLLLTHFEAGVFVPEAEGLLRDAMQSPHQAVRAAARYHLACFLAHKAKMAEIFGPGAKPLDLPADVPAAVLEIVRRRREQVNKLGIDPAAARKEVIELAAELVAEYSDVVQSLAMQENRDELDIRRTDAKKYGLQVRAYAKMAESLRFELEHLQGGQIAPDITGQDAEGTEFKLSDYRGRVVLLMFSANWCGPCKAMYPDLRKLQAEFSDEPFAILAIMGDQKHDTVINDTKSGEIRWRTWFDGNHGPIATTWNIHSWPTLLLLDQQGVIVDREAGRSFEVLRRQIDPLLAAQKSDPAAQKLRKTKPLPELPILKHAK
jgi:thiol-disulfide isomerase/thioredoxin